METKYSIKGASGAHFSFKPQQLPDPVCKRLLAPQKAGAAACGKSPSFRGYENRSFLALWVKIIPLFAYKEIRDQKVPEMCQSHSQTWRKPNCNPGFCDFKAFIVAILSRLKLHCSNTVSVGRHQKSRPPRGQATLVSTLDAASYIRVTQSATGTPLSPECSEFRP